MQGADWHPGTPLEVLRLRAQWFRRIRQFFMQRDVLEVDTPVLSIAGCTDPAVKNPVTYLDGRDYYLQSSPEFYMKRLLSAGIGSIYQLSHVFRDDEQGRLHQPEFMLLEWYRPGYDQHQLMREVAELVGKLCQLIKPDNAIDLVSYQSLFLQYTAINPFEEDWRLLLQYDCPVVEADGWDAALDWLMAFVIQPQMKGLCFVNDYPASQAALARLNDENSAVSCRFELFIEGIEIANGFEELTDASEQKQRFEAENVKRLHNGQPVVALDERFLQALDAGMPQTSGVALGVDRLLMWKCHANSLNEVVPFALG